MSKAGSSRTTGPPPAVAATAPASRQAARASAAGSPDHAARSRASAGPYAAAYRRPSSRSASSRGGGLCSPSSRANVPSSGWCSKPSSAARRSRWGRRCPLASTPAASSTARSSSRRAGPSARRSPIAARARVWVSSSRPSARRRDATLRFAPGATSDSTQGTSSRASRCSVPRQAHTRTTSSDRSTSPATSPSLRTRTLNRAAAASCAWIPHTARTTSATPPPHRGASRFAANRPTIPSNLTGRVTVRRAVRPGTRRSGHC